MRAMPKPLPVEAYQYTDDTDQQNEVQRWVENTTALYHGLLLDCNVAKREPTPECHYAWHWASLWIQDSKGKLQTCQVGDWIVLDPCGVVRVLPDDDFRELYDVVDV